MIRRLTVPPFEALDPYLPRLAGADHATRQTVAAILDDVLARGDFAVVDYTRQYDQVDLRPRCGSLMLPAGRGRLDQRPAPLREALSRRSGGSPSTTSASATTAIIWRSRTAAWLE